MAWQKGTGARVAVLGTILIVLVVLGWLSMGNISSSPMASNESMAVASLRSYLGAQGTFKRGQRYRGSGIVYANPFSGRGLPDLYEVGGAELKLIDLALAQATSPAKAKAGYWFIDIIADRRAGAYDFTKDCGLCAMPVVHGETGLNTYIIDSSGTPYRKDNGGKPVTVFPDVEKEGWVPVGE